MHTSFIPAEHGLGLFAFLVLTSSFQILGGLLCYIFLTKLKGQEKKMIIIGLMLMFFIVFYSSQFISKQWSTLFVFLAGLGVVYAVHTFLTRKMHPSNGMAIFSMIGIHEIIEGLFVSGMFLFDVKIGLASGLFVAVHEMPEGMITGMPFFLRKQVRKGFLLIILSQVLYIVAGTAIPFLGLSRTALQYVDAFLIGSIMALGITQLQMLRKPS